MDGKTYLLSRIQLIIRIFIYAVVLFLSDQLFAQTQAISAFFIKKQIYQKSGELSFNVVRVVNLSDSSISIHPILTLPDGWTTFSNSIRDTIIPSGDSISIPFRLRIPSKIHDQEAFTIFFQCYSTKNKLVTECRYLVNIEVLHRWDITGPQQRVLLLPNTVSTNFDIKLSNNGNTSETIHLELLPDKKLSILNKADGKFETDIKLLPNHDTTLTYAVSYNYNENRIFDLGKIQINATNGTSTIYRSVFAEKYSDKYAPFSIEEGLLHTTELGFRTFSKNNEILPYLKTRGSTTFKNDGTFKYNFTYYNLTDREDIIGNSYYNFLYSIKSLNVGLGAFSSMLGRNLYSRNSVMISNKIKLSPGSMIEGYASYGFIDNKMSVALGYNYNYKKLAMKATGSYDLDELRKTNTASMVLHSNQISIAKNHDISAIIYGYNEKHYLNDTYILGGFAYDLNYSARISSKFQYQITNSMGSRNIPGSQQGLFSLVLRSTIGVGKSKNYFSGNFFTTERSFNQYTQQGKQLPYTYLRDQFGSLFFNYAGSKAIRFHVGPSVEFYYSSNPSRESNQREVFRIEKYRLDLKTFYKRFLMVHLKYGLGNLYYLNSNKPGRSDYDFHIICDLSFKGIGVQTTYDYGPMASSGLYQYSSDAKTNIISVSPYALTSFWSGRIKFSLFSNIAYRFDLEYGTVNINPRIEAYLFNNWYAVTSGTYSYAYQNYEANSYGSGFYYLEFAVKKNWGKSYDNRWRNDLKRCDIQMFKDDNGNGKKDITEKGIPNIKVSLKLTNSAIPNGKDNIPIDITLVTNEKGIASFNSIPKGFYDLIINPLTDLMEYFYIGHNNEKIELIKNQMVQIPFQKAHKLEGSIDVKRQKFIKDSELTMNLGNIKVTAYNNLGNSYSSFTDADGKFMIYVPGDQIYYVRIGNVFGENYVIQNNDINAPVPETVGHPIVFQVVEKNRQVNFKKVAQPKPDTIDYNLQKIKVLAGNISKIDESKKAAVEDAFKPKADKKALQPGKYYLVLAEAKNLVEAVKYRKIFAEQGLIISFGYDDSRQLIYIYTNYYNKRDDAQLELKIVEKMGIKSAYVMRFQPK